MCSLYGFLHVTLHWLFSLLFRLKVIGHENIPTEGGVIIAANHISNWDPLMLGTAMQRPLSAMAKEELFKTAILRFIINKLHAFPVRRGTFDRAAIVTALTLLKEDRAVLLFPEGTRSKTGKLGEGKHGVAMLAAKAGVPIIPAAIIGTNKIGKPFLPHVAIQFGKPINCQGSTDKESLQKVTEEIMQSLGAMINERNV